MIHMFNMWLDDVRNPLEHGAIGFIWVKTAAEAIALLETGGIKFASLDHDLAEQHYPWNCTELPARGAATGYDVCCWLEEHPEFWPPNGVRVHSMNTAGKYRMCQVIDKHYGGNSFEGR